MKNIRYIQTSPFLKVGGCLLIIVLTFLVNKQCYSQFTPEQQHQIDSLNKIIANPNSLDTALVGAYVTLSGILYVSNFDTIKSLCEKAKNIAEKALKDQPSVAIKKSLLGNLAVALNNIGYAYKRQWNVSRTLEYYHKSLKIREEIGSKKGIANSLNNIGSVYSTQGEIMLALEYYHKSLKIREEIGFKKGIATTLSNIGSIYYNQKEIVLALEYYRKSLKIREEIGSKKGIANALSNIGSTYYKQGETLLALKFYRKSLKIREEIGDKFGLAINLNNLGNIELKRGDEKRLSIAKQHLKKALNLGQEIGSPKAISSSSNNLSKLYKKEGKGLLALEMYQLHIIMRDSLNNETTQKATAQQQAKYKYEKQKVLDDVESEKLIAIEKEAQIKQKVIIYAIAAGLGLVVLFLIFVFNRLRVTKKQKIVIEAQKDEVETQRDEIEEAHKEITDSINYAERIQRSFLATKDVLDENLKDYFVFFKPKDVVSGDFYWAGKLTNNNFAVVNADSTGHGVPGAIMSILNISSIEKAVEQNLVNPSEIFNATRKTIIDRLKKDGSVEGGKDGMDASIISFDFANQKFTYTAANNPIWIIRKCSPLEKGVRGIDSNPSRHAEFISASNKQTLKQVQGDVLENNDEYELIEIKPEKMPIGKHDNDNIPFVGGEFETQKGDVVYTLTDGFQDQFGGEKGKKFKVRPFKELLISIAHLPMQEQKEILTQKFTTWKGEEEQVDDVCVIGVRV